jgi:hypothetical protein
MVCLTVALAQSVHGEIVKQWLLAMEGEIQTKELTLFSVNFFLELIVESMKHQLYKENKLKSPQSRRLFDKEFLSELQVRHVRNFPCQPLKIRNVSLVVMGS